MSAQMLRLTTRRLGGLELRHREPLDPAGG
jgi:hypothetical protein